MQLATPGAFPINPFYFLIGLTYGLSVVYLATLRYVDDSPWLVDLQLTVDAGAGVGLHRRDRRHQSDFSSLYLLPILAASTLRDRRGALQVAAVSAVLYFAIVLSQYTTLETFPRWSLTRRFRRCRRRASRSTWWPPTCSASSPWARWPARWPSACARPAAAWPTRRRRSRTCARSTST